MNIEKETIWLEINLGAIRRNIQRIAKYTSRPVMAVVKANAYGHGLIPVAQTAIKAGVTRLCVARIEEATRLREAGIQSPILVMGYTRPEMIREAINLGVSLTVADPEAVKLYNRIAKQEKGRVHVHGKIDTGMSRLGVFPADGLEFGKLIQKMEGLSFEGLYTHFACADDPQNLMTGIQIGRFERVIHDLEKAGIRPQIIHAANSAAALGFPASWYDAVRPGIAIYGLHPSSEAPLPMDFEAALSWKCRLTSSKVFPAGTGVGYNHRFTTEKEERIGAAACGYADGLRRRLGNVALMGGQRVRQAGGMCMDQSMWRIDNVPGAKIGDEMVLVGKQGEGSITAEEVAGDWGTNNYELVCGLTERVPRFYIDE